MHLFKNAQMLFAINFMFLLASMAVLLKHELGIGCFEESGSPILNRLALWHLWEENSCARQS
jgi:hypothetical protein